MRVVVTKRDGASFQMPSDTHRSIGNPLGSSTLGRRVNTWDRN